MYFAKRLWSPPRLFIETFEAAQAPAEGSAQASAEGTASGPQGASEWPVPQ